MALVEARLVRRDLIPETADLDPTGSCLPKLLAASFSPEAQRLDSGQEIYRKVWGP